MCDLKTVFLIRGLRVEDQENGFLEVPISVHVFFVCEAGSKRKSAHHNQEHLINWNKKTRDTFDVAPLDFLRKLLSLCLSGCTKWQCMGFKMVKEL